MNCKNIGHTVGENLHPLKYNRMWTIRIIVSYAREFAKLLVRYTDNAQKLVKQLRGVVKNSCGDEVVLFHELIKKMPGMLS